uniref:Tetraspanin n=1 Tax=Hemiselmis andersenii TaxID=464988 RepID=A0A6U2H396_HEMAN|mmetsp:Transcript_39495/g.92408  ORF Transcript_39495/g.92408 Transcript_39495/m.92408 type:complete len:234 (+) Transcript_39495:254-955(+)
MGVIRSSCRCAAEFFSTILLVCAFALMGFGGFFLYKWRSDPVTEPLPPPNYVYLVLGFGAALAFANVLSLCGACCRTRCCLGMSVCLSFILLIAQLALVIVIFVDPSAIDQQVCPADDASCLEKLYPLFKDPAQHAGILLSVVCTVQIMAMCSVHCLKDMEGMKQRRDEEEGEAIDRPLREEDWQERQAEIERKAQRKLELHKQALSATAKQALERRERLLNKGGSPRGSVAV